MEFWHLKQAYLYICIVAYACVRVCTYVGVHVCVRVLKSVFNIYIYIYLYIRLHATVFRTHLVRSELSFRRLGPDSDWCSLWTRCVSDSKTDPWDDLQISTGSCSEDQTAIRFRNRVISCECLLLSHFLIYRCQYALHVIFIILCDFPSYFTSLITCTGS